MIIILNIKLGDFGHPFLRTSEKFESFTMKKKCTKKDFDKMEKLSRRYYKLNGKFL